MAHLTPDQFVIVLILAIAIVFVLTMMAIQVFVAWFLYDAWNRIPPPYREGESWHAWLLLVPFVNLVMPFFVHPRISRSYRNYLAAWNIHDAGDCGEQLGLACAVCTACSVVPYLGLLAAMAGVVLVIVYIVKLNGLKKRLGVAAPPPFSLPATPPTPAPAGAPASDPAAPP